MKYFRRKRTTKRTYKRRPRRQRKAVMGRNISGSGFNKQQLVRFKYCSNVEIDPAAGAIGVHFFRANSTFDPDSTGVGHQPYHWDQWTSMYDHYVVIGSKITARFISRINDTSVPLANMVCGIRLEDNGSLGSTNPETECERDSRYRFLSHGRHTQVKSFYSPKKFFGIKDIGDNVNRLGASTTANPTEDVYFACWAAAPNALDNPTMIDCHVMIEYIVMLTERKDAVGS